MSKHEMRCYVTYNTVKFEYYCIFESINMAEVFTPQLSHVGIFVRNMELMCNFYTTIFDLRITDKGRGRRFNNDLVFFSADPGQHHQLVLSSGRPVEATFSTVMQLAFKVVQIEDLRRISRAAALLGAQRIMPLNHGNALSVYMGDPEDNTVEVYLDTPYYVSQPHGDPLDLDKTDDELWRETEATCRADPSFMLVKGWQEKFVAETQRTA